MGPVWLRSQQWGWVNLRSPFLPNEQDFPPLQACVWDLALEVLLSCKLSSYVYRKGRRGSSRFQKHPGMTPEAAAREAEPDSPGVSAIPIRPGSPGGRGPTAWEHLVLLCLTLAVLSGL